MNDNDKELWIKFIRNTNLYQDNRKLAIYVAANCCCVKNGELLELPYFVTDSFTYVNIPQGITKLGHHAFFESYYLKNITIPNSVVSIGNNAFALCARLESITIPNSVTSIGHNAFPPYTEVIRT